MYLEPNFIFYRSGGVLGPIYKVKMWFIRVQRSNIEKLYFFDFFFDPGEHRDHLGSTGGYLGVKNS